MARPASPVIRWLAKAASRIFYRVDCIGSIPADGAALLLPNHPNALLDPAIVWATASRDIRFLAKSTLFAGPWRPVLAGAGAIPVYRRLDQGADVSRNAETFAAVDKALADGDAICIFPEGFSHSSGRLEPLRTGAARMALASESAGISVALVPVGLNFERKAAFRSRVTVVYGRPFSAADLASGNDTPHAERVRALTERIADHIRRLLIEADPRADAAIVDRVDRLYAAARGRPKDPAERLSRRRVIADGIQRLRDVDPAKYDELLLRLRRYAERLRRFGLRDRHLDWQVPNRDAAKFAARELAAAIVLMPLAALGFALFFAPYHATGVAARRFTRELDVIATAQVVAGAVIYGAWFAFAGWIVWRLWGPAAAALAAALLPVIALLSLFAIERESAVIDAVRAWFLLRRARGETRERLRRRRSELADVLDDVYGMLNAE
jgi:glycerol-3-phosphate O-acyltransferase / dihydroxyacetone phosphate acyltransferase